MSKTVLITGGTDGIGKDLAYQFALRRFTVHILGRDQEKGEAVIRGRDEFHRLMEYSRELTGVAFAASDC